jgi:pimeloyl-ACP methyl ester carboxylesterase
MQRLPADNKECDDMNRVNSKDGTSIAYDRQGEDPAVILVGGALDDGSENAPLATELAERFTVYNYARRGRGESGDTAPYAVQRELEDIAALIAVAGGSAHLYGVSSGGMFALEAAAAGLRIERLAVYEVPYDTSDNAPQRYCEYTKELDTALVDGRRGDAVALFMQLAGSSPAEIEAARNSPYVHTGSCASHLTTPCLQYAADGESDARNAAACLVKDS